jgi:hypothetical protein
VDPAFEALAGHPAFFTAGWSAARPNVSRSFIALAKAIREEAMASARPLVPVTHLRDAVGGRLSEEEVRRVEEVARASHVVMPKVQLIVHSLYRAARRERIPGTGREEPPIRRGVPEWQRWMSAQPIPDDSGPIIEESSASLSLPGPASALRLMARWPDALSSVWERLRVATNDERWRGGAMRLRRLVLGGMGSLPHPVELQWTALRQRGLTEEERLQIVDVLGAHDASMAVQTMIATFAWMAVGAPEIGLEG